MASKELPITGLLSEEDATLREAPQPFTRGMPGMVCVFCYGEYGAADALEAEDAWVCCPWCEEWLHEGGSRLLKFAHVEMQ